MDPLKRYLPITLLSILILGLIPTAGQAELPDIDIQGFAEHAYGIKVSDDTTKRDNYHLLEQRLQLESLYFFEGDHYLAEKGGILNFKGDFTVDEYYSGKTDFALRELNLSFTPQRIVDAKIGRQILTWGTGDYLFINDMFPKDYISFFSGRDDEYLKKPSDAVKLSFYPELMNIDFVVIPYFTPNTHAKGDRLSFFDSFQSGIAGLRSDRDLVEPAFQMENNEYALRLYRNFSGKEVAFYYFRGFDKSPRSYKNELKRQLYYERLDVYGASIRGAFAGGIANFETGYVFSREDADGTDRKIANSMFKAMAGYSKDLGNDLRVGLQYYYEQILDYDNYTDNLLANDYFWDEHRHLLTQRITKLFKRQTVEFSFFNFYSPSDNDGYVRSSIGYDITDQWNVTAGVNIPWGEDVITEFAQMKRNKNVYFRVRFSF
jgi:hypothetical protein